MICKELIKSIKSFEIDRLDIEIRYNDKIEIIDFLSKFNSTKTPSLKIIFNDRMLNRYDKVTYECPICHLDSKIFIDKFLKKKTLFCYKCKEQNPEKIDRQSKYITKSYKDFGKVQKLKQQPEKNTYEIIKKTENEFEKETQDFKNQYFEKNLTIDEFKRIIKDIKSIDGVEIENKKVEYFPIFKCNNQMKYSPSVLINDKIHRFKNLEFYCSMCADDFKARNEKNKAINGTLCPSCNFSNKIFKFKSIKNLNGKNVIYQSSPELKLIEHCNKNKILIKNGPKIEYDFMGKRKLYKVDFEIPSKRLLIEVKDMHIWHREQLDSGKWLAKENEARKFATKHGYIYYLIFKVDILIENYL